MSDAQMIPSSQGVRSEPTTAVDDPVALFSALVNEHVSQTDIQWPHKAIRALYAHAKREGMLAAAGIVKAMRTGHKHRDNEREDAHYEVAARRITAAAERLTRG